MSRNTSKGLTYFNIDCVEQDNLEYVQLVHGIIGYGVLVKLWKRIYQVEGYYCKWDEKALLFFAKKEVDVDIEQVHSIVETCLSEGIFSRTMFDKYGILTSDGIQKRWLRIVTEAKRKEKDLDPKFDLLTITPEFNANTPEDKPNTPEEWTQSKVKEKKEKENKKEEEETPVENFQILINLNPVNDLKKLIKEKFFRSEEELKMKVGSTSYFERQEAFMLRNNERSYTNNNDFLYHYRNFILSKPPPEVKEKYSGQKEKPNKVEQFQTNHNEVINDIRAAAAQH